MSLLGIDYLSSEGEQDEKDQLKESTHVQDTQPKEPALNKTTTQDALKESAGSKAKDSTSTTRKDALGIQSSIHVKKSSTKTRQASIQESHIQAQIENPPSTLQHSHSEEALLEKSKQLLRPPVHIELPPEPQGECNAGLQAKIDKWIQLKQSGMHFNERLNKTGSFRNPSILTKLIEYLELNEYGSHLTSRLFDASGIPEEAYYDKLAEVQKQRFQTSTAPTFVSSGYQEPEPPIPAQAPSNVNAAIEKAKQKAKRFAEVLAQQSVADAKKPTKKSTPSSPIEEPSKRQKR